MLSYSISVAVVVPTLNAGTSWVVWLEKLRVQTLPLQHVLIIDSSSDDATASIAVNAGCDVRIIPRSEFNHGTTRQLAADILVDADIIVYLTQDALLAHEGALACLVEAFTDHEVGVAYGRQLPHHEAKLIGSHARLFNYPETSEIRTMSDASRLGIKTAFTSNSFAAYRRNALMMVGGFPSNSILSEDTYVSAKMLLASWKIAYCAEAKVFHSHDYSIIQEFNRYFDIGVFHARESWVRLAFGSAESEGKKFVISEILFLMRHSPWQIPSAILRTFVKYAGYQLGLHEENIPIALKRKLSMHKGFWSKHSAVKLNE